MVDLARPAHVGDVNHAVDALFEFDKRAVGRQIANLAAHVRANGIVVDCHFPRIFFELAQAEGNLLLFLVDVEDNRLDFVADLENLGGLW